MSGATMTAANFGLAEYYDQSIPPELYASDEPPTDVPPEPDVEPPEQPDTEEVPVVPEPEPPVPSAKKRKSD